MHTPQSLADVLERDYFPMPDGAKLYLAEHEWRMVIDALRASPPEAEGKDLIAYAARYSWLRDKSANQYEHPIAVSQTRTEGGMNYVGPLLGKALDEAIDAVLSRSEEKP
jgi:hypothetical protein